MFFFVFLVCVRDTPKSQICSMSELAVTRVALPRTHLNIVLWNSLTSRLERVLAPRNLVHILKYQSNAVCIETNHLQLFACWLYYSMFVYLTDSRMSITFVQAIWTTYNRIYTVINCIFTPIHRSISISRGFPNVLIFFHFSAYTQKD